MILRPPRDPGRAPRLVLRFAAYTAAALLLTAVGLLLFVRHYATARAQSAAAFHTRFVADTVIRNELRPADFARRATGARLARLDALFGSEVLVSGALRVKLYGRDRHVAYSNEHPLIGSLPPDLDVVERALAGQTTSESVLPAGLASPKRPTHGTGLAGKAGSREPERRAPAWVSS